MKKKPEPDSLFTRARAMRREPSDAERHLWQHLRARQVAGFKFRRQVIVGCYIVDFVCTEARLVVEADGGQHGAQRVYVRKRSDDLAAGGYAEGAPRGRPNLRQVGRAS